MRKQLKKFTVSISLLLVCLLLPSLITLCCGPVLYADESRFALFRNGLDERSSLTPFNYSENLFTVGEADPKKLDYWKNCREWVDFAHSNVKEEDVYTVQYATLPDTFIHAVATKNWRGFGDNSFIRWLTKNENKAALQYMLLAKQAENAHFEPGDPWDTTIASKGIELDTIAARADKAIESVTPKFLKERYAFQAVKMYYYSGKQYRDFNRRLMQLFNEYLDNKRSIVAGWASLYYALAQDDKVNRLLYLIKAFDESEEKKKFSFQLIDKNDLAALEAVTKDPKRLALINTIKALKNKGRAINEVRAVAMYDQSSSYLPLLISREVNKLENWIWSAEILGFYNNLRADEDAFDASKPRELTLAQYKDRQYLQIFTAYLDSIVDVVPTQKTLRQLALVHLYNIGQQYNKANLLLRQLAPQNNDVLESQRQIESIITVANIKDVTTNETQREIAASLKKLIKLNSVFIQQLDRSKYDNWEDEGDNEQNDDLSELYMLLSRCFKKRGDIVTAGLLYTKANVVANYYDGWEDTTSANYKSIAYFDRWASTQDIDKLLRFKHSTSKTPFQKLISPFNWASDDMYKDLKGTILFRQKKYEQALAVFSSIAPDFWQKNYEFKSFLPLTSVTHTGKLIPSEKSVASKYKRVSKQLIVAEIVNLINTIKSSSDNRKKAELYYKLGNSYLNTSFYGKAWMMMSYGKSTNEIDDWDNGNYKWAFYNFYPHKLTYKANYYQCKSASEMFKKALALTTDRELAAKSLLSLSFCDAVAHGKSSWQYNIRKTYYSPYLKQFVKSYTNTVAYRYAKTECPDVKSYLSR